MHVGFHRGIAYPHTSMRNSLEDVMSRMGNLKMGDVQQHPAREFEPRGLLHAHAEPRCGPRSMVFATAPCSGIEPHRSAPRRADPWAQASCATESDRKEVDTSSFVLVVDDDPDLLEVTSFVIEGEGLAVETAKNGEEALALLRAGRLPTLVLLDLMMPVMNGWEFLATIAKDPLFQHIPVVVLTAGEHTEVPGAMEVVSKPMDLNELLRLVEQYVRGDRDAGD
jgi:CheY-like chemotaxis protein